MVGMVFLVVSRVLPCGCYGILGGCKDVVRSVAKVF